jgi:hypothetical protein
VYCKGANLLFRVVKSIRVPRNIMQESIGRGGNSPRMLHFAIHVVTGQLYSPVANTEKAFCTRWTKKKETGRASSQQKSSTPTGNQTSAFQSITSQYLHKFLINKPMFLIIHFRIRIYGS